MTIGVAAAGLVTWLLFSGREDRDWLAVARQHMDARDWPALLDAATRCVEKDPENYQGWFLRAMAQNMLGMPERALQDVATALRGAPDDVGFLSFRSAVLSAEGNDEEAIRVLDEALARLPTHDGLRLNTARARLFAHIRLDESCRRRLENDFLDRTRLPALLDDFYASHEADCRPLRLLLEPLPESQLKRECEEDLRRAWTLLREADEIIGDPRRNGMWTPQVSLVRAELDLRFGRLLRAKEELQIMLQTGMPLDQRRQFLITLAKVLERLEAYPAQAAYLRELVDLETGPAGAPMFRLADVLEAEFHAARQSPQRREAFLAAADLHLARYRTRDLRTVGYRGVAAIEFAGRPDEAIELLEDVYEALRLQRDKDPTILEPRRARTFMLALLEAYLAGQQPQRGLQVANTLVELSPGDPELRRRRARILHQLGRHSDAAADLLEAMRGHPRSHELFTEWLETASSVRDASGRTPRERALEATEELRTRKEILHRQLEAIGNWYETNKFRQNPQHVTKALARVASLQVDLANDPILAWHMAEEFGRLGEETEARNFLFKAARAEPAVPAFRFRLAQFRLDLGAFESAARDFEQIVDVDPNDIEAAAMAAEAWLLAGDLARSREVRARALLADPEHAGLHFSVLAALDAGQPTTALEIVRMHFERTDPEMRYLLGRVQLANGNAPKAIETFQNLLADRPLHAEGHVHLLRALAIEGRHDEYESLVERFVALPRLVPAVYLEELFTQLEELGRHREAAYLARRVADRFPERVELSFIARAALDAFLAGDAGLMRTLRDQMLRGERHDNALVRAAFGLTLREEGPQAAATLLQVAREHTTEAAWAELPLAATFALTPFASDVTTFLGRYEGRHEDRPIPLEDAVLWWVTRGRDPRPRGEPAVERGAEGEQAFIQQARELAGPDDLPLDEIYLRFLLFRFAGAGFEPDAREYADRLVAIDKRALSAARFLAGLEKEERSAGAAAVRLLEAYQSLPGDVLTFEMLGELLAEADPVGDLLASLASGGRQMFPGRTSPWLFTADAALRRGFHPTAHEALAKVLELEPGHREALLRMAENARDSGSAAYAVEAAREIAARRPHDPELRGFLVEHFAALPPADPEIRAVLQPLVEADPTFYAGALVLAKAFEETGRTAEIEALIRRVATAVAVDPRAAGAADDLVKLVALACDRQFFDAAVELIDAALHANPADVPLRQRKVELQIARRNAPAAIDDLRLLCVLRPWDPRFLFDYGTVLLEERTEDAGIVIQMLPRMHKVAPEDPRLFALTAKIRFRRDDIGQAALDIFEALRREPHDAGYWYQSVVLAFLAHDDGALKNAATHVPSTHPFHKRVQRLVDLAAG